MLERRCGTWTTRASALHRQVNNAIPKAAVANVAAITCYGWTDPGFDQFLDLLDHFGIGWIIADFVIFRRDSDTVCAAAREEWCLADEMIQQDRDDLRLEHRPFGTGSRGNGNEVASEKHPSHFASVEQRLRERGCAGFLGRGEVACAGGHDGLPRKELERCRVRGGFGLDEHAPDVGSKPATGKQSSLVRLEA